MELGLLLTVIGVGGLGVLAGLYARLRRPLVVTVPVDVSHEQAAHIRDLVARWDRRRPIVLTEGVTIAEFGS